MTGSPANSGSGATVYLPATHSREVDVDQAFLALKKWLAVMGHQWHLATAIYEWDVAEIRKFGVGCIFATQSLHQMATRLQEIMLANVGSVLTFRASPRDAAHLDALFPTVTTRSMQTLPRHHVALTTFESDAILTTPPPLPVPDHVETWRPQSEKDTETSLDGDAAAVEYRGSVGSADSGRRAQPAPSTESRRS